MITLKTGDHAPSFTAEDHLGNAVKLNDFKGHKLILYFYPKDDTPGCTAEACNLKDNHMVYGVLRNSWEENMRGSTG